VPHLIFLQHQNIVHYNEILLFVTANKVNVFIVSNVLLIITPGKMQPDTIKHKLFLANKDKTKMTNYTYKAETFLRSRKVLC
jgi:hypothetical protein